MQQTSAQNSEAIKISFIITYYDIPIWMLEECIQSIICLPVNDVEREIILVDDGSHTDLTSLLQDHPFIRYISQANQGPAIARNTGLNAATGSHIQFVDADDYLLTEGYKHIIQRLRESPTLDVVMLGFTQSKKINTRIDDTSVMSGAEYMLNHNLRCADWTFLFSRKAMGNLRFTPGIYHEDEEFTPLLLLQANRVMYSSACAYFYRKREDSIVNKNEPIHLKKRLNDAEQIILRLRDKAKTLSKLEQKALMRRVHQTTMDHIYNVATLTRNEALLEIIVERFRQQGLFPLADENYTTKYKWFRRISSYKIGRKLMLHFMPHSS